MTAQSRARAPAQQAADGPVAEALRAAAVAILTESERDFVDRCHDGAPGPGHIAAAAAAVEAFLRALSGPYRLVALFGEPIPERLSPWLADAVARAAQMERE